MRCMNCGWENPDNLMKCEKCNSPLESNIPHDASARPVPEHQEVLRGTISEQRIFADSVSTDNEGNCCPKCGYPLRDGLHRCPNCGEYLDSVKQSSTPKKEFHNVAHNHNATVNPWANPNAGKSFKLEPVAWDGEKDTPSAQSFIGESVELNRDNTDPTNITITSKVQAEISHDHGVWSIEDKSSQSTTFIQAKRKIELEDGDIIMLGNRKFIFKVE